MTNSAYMDLSGFGIETSVEGHDYREYAMPEKEGSIYMKSYYLIPGIELFYNDFNTKSHFCGRNSDCRYYQISYCHSGLYVSHISQQRILKLQAKEILVFRDIMQNLDSYMPLGYYRGINIIFYPDLLPKETVKLFGDFNVDIGHLFQKLLKSKIFSRFTTNEHVLEVLEKLFEMSKKGDRLHMKLYLMHLLVELEHYDGAVEEQYRCISSKMMDTVAEVKNYIEENMSMHITIRDLAGQYQISATSLKDNFKILYGYGPYEFLKRKRMSKAAELLKNTALSVSEIGSHVGYENPSKFSAAFWGIYGVTPAAYRKNG